MKFRDVVTPVALLYVVYRAMVFLIRHGSSSKITNCLGVLHELLQLNDDDHTVQFEDGTETSVSEAIDHYMDELIKELQHG